MAGRLSRLRAAMAAADMEAAIFTSYHNVNYFSDFLYCAFGRPYALVVTHDAATTVSANIDGGPALSPQRRRKPGLYRLAARQFLRCLAESSLGGKTRIGVEYDHISLERLEKAETGPARRHLSGHRRAGHGAAHGEVGGGDRRHSQRRAHRRHRRRGLPRGHRRGRAGTRGRPGLDRGHGARDRPRPIPMPS